MKKITKSYLYLLMVSLAAITVFLLEGPWREKKGDLLNKPLYENFDKTKVSRMEVEHLLNGVQLKKENNQWIVADFKAKLKGELEKRDQGPTARGEEKWYVADNNRVDLSLTALQDLQLTSLAGNNPEHHGFFEVNAAGEQVRLFNERGEKSAHLYIGKTGPAFTESYVRREGENEVYLANRYLRSSFPIEVNDWRDHTIWNVSQETIEAIQIERAENSFTLKKEGKWRLAKPKPSEVDQAKASQLAGQLAKVVASDFVEDSQKTGLEKPDLSITLITASGPLSLKVGKEKELGEHFAKKEGESQIYLLRENLLKAIPKDWKEVLK